MAYLIPEIIKNVNCKRNALRCSQIMKNGHHTYLRILAADMVEKFIHWDFNASHLQPATSSISSYEYFSLKMFGPASLSIVEAVLLLEKLF